MAEPNETTPTPIRIATTKTPIRIGTFPLRTLPFDYLNRVNAGTFPHWQEIISSTKDILRRNNILTFMQYWGACSYRDPPAGRHLEVPEPHIVEGPLMRLPVALLTEDDVVVGGRAWIAVQELLLLFATWGAEGIGLELYDAGMWWWETWPVTVDDEALLRTWPDVAEKVMEVLFSFNDRWQSLSLVWQGEQVRDEHPAREKRPTVIVTTWSPDPLVWEDGIVPTITGAVEEFSSGWELWWQRAEAPCVEAPKTDVELWTTDAQMGDDIGVPGSTEAGTIGGFIKLRDREGKDTEYALTSSRVVRTEELWQEAVPCPNTANSPVPSLDFGKERNKFAVHQPSNVATARKKDSMSKQLEWRENDLRRLETRRLKICEQEASERESRQPDMLQKQCEGVADDLRKQKEDLAAIKDSDRLFGHVRALSGQHHGRAGKEQPRPKAADWALIGAPSPRKPCRYREISIRNRAVCNLPGNRLHKQKEQELWPDKLPGINTWIEDTTPSSDVVFKKGARTGWTLGRVNRAPAYLHVLDDGDCKTCYGGVIQCVRIENALRDVQAEIDENRGETTEKNNYGVFAAQGDCGAAVLDGESGVWRGLVIACAKHGKWMNAGFMATAESVVEDVERVMRSGLVKPEREMMGWAFDGRSRVPLWSKDRLPG